MWCCPSSLKMLIYSSLYMTRLSVETLDGNENYHWWNSVFKMITLLKRIMLLKDDFHIQQDIHKSCTHMTCKAFCFSFNASMMLAGSTKAFWQSFPCIWPGASQLLTKVSQYKDLCIQWFPFLLQHVYMSWAIQFITWEGA